MQWTKPEFTEISLGGELTAYVNTDDPLRMPQERPPQTESLWDPDGMPHRTSA